MVKGIYDKVIDKKIQEILSLCYRVSTETKSDVFCEYYPHIDCIEIRIYVNGWKSQAGPDVDFDYCRLKHKDDSTEQWNKNINNLNEIIDYLKDILKEGSKK